MYFHFRISLGCVLQYLHLWLHTSLFLIWISLSIIMPHFIRYWNVHSDLNSDHYLNVLLSELHRTPWLGGQAAWRDVSYQHFPSCTFSYLDTNKKSFWVSASINPRNILRVIFNLLKNAYPNMFWLFKLKANTKMKSPEKKLSLFERVYISQKCSLTQLCKHL